MSQEQDLTQDAIFDVLSSPRRRYVLYHLQTHGETDILDLAAEVAAWEYQQDVDSLTDQQRKRVYVSLYQTHVPKMADLGLLDYDQDEGTVRPTSQASEVNRHLTAETGADPPWQLLYLGAALVSGTVIGLVLADVSVFAAVPAVTAAIVVAVGFALIAVSHYLYQVRQRRQLPPELQYDEG